MSSSVILSKQLEIESSELTSYITNFFDEKEKEFSARMKEKIGKMVKSQVLHFYNGPSHNIKLFDKDGSLILSRIEEQFKKRNWIQVLQENQAYLNQPNKMCFKINSETENASYHFFENCVILCGDHYLYECSEEPGFTFSILPHMLTHDMLRTIKHFQLGKRGNLEQGIKIHTDHPELFNTNCTDFEYICEEEYKLISLKKKELDRLIKEGERIEQEHQKLMEEKKQLLSVKQKLSLMRLELDKERIQFEKSKIRDAELSEYFQDIF